MNKVKEGFYLGLGLLVAYNVMALLAYTVLRIAGALFHV